jgi:DNA-binding NarL/FixJ family response regulator
LLAEGYSNKEVAHLLGLQPRTVETHRKNLMAKCRAHTILELIKKAREHGWLP